MEVEHHQWRAYGGWTYALQDYLDMDIMTRLDTPEMNLLQQMEDPYFYKVCICVFVEVCECMCTGGMEPFCSQNG